MLPTVQIDFRRTPVTLILSALIVGLEVVCTLEPQRLDFYYYDMRLGISPLVWYGDLWQPFSSSLLHANLLHALFNVYWLVIFGAAIEDWCGPARFLGLVILLAYVSTMAQFAINAHPSLGFSGVGYGLFGIMLVGRRYQSHLAWICNRDTVRLFIGWFFFCIIATHFGLMPVANIAHGAGWVFGMLYGMAMFPTRRRWWWLAAAVIATALVLTTLVYCPWNEQFQMIQRAKEMRQWIDPP